MPVLTHLGIFAMFGFLQWPAPASVFSLALHRKGTNSLYPAGWDQGETMSKSLAVSLEQLCAVLPVGKCYRPGGMQLSAEQGYLAWQEPSSHKAGWNHISFEKGEEKSKGSEVVLSAVYRDQWSVFFTLCHSLFQDFALILRVARPKWQCVY